jgi:hypothetical protein
MGFRRPSTYFSSEGLRHEDGFPVLCALCVLEVHVAPESAMGWPRLSLPLSYGVILSALRPATLQSPENSTHLGVYFEAFETLERRISSVQRLHLADQRPYMHNTQPGAHTNLHPPRARDSSLSNPHLETGAHVAYAAAQNTGHWVEGAQNDARRVVSGGRDGRNTAGHRRDVDCGTG